MFPSAAIPLLLHCKCYSIHSQRYKNNEKHNSICAYVVELTYFTCDEFIIIFVIRFASCVLFWSVVFYNFVE